MRNLIAPVVYGIIYP